MKDFSQWIIFDPEKIDTSKTLWMVRDIVDVDCLKGTGINACTFRTSDAYEKAAKFFQQFPRLFIAIPENDPEINPKEVSERLSNFSPLLPILLPRKGAFGEFKSIRDAMRGGKEKVNDLIKRAVEIPVQGLIDLGTVPYVDFSQENVIVSGFPDLDMISGGFSEGQLSVWTASEGQGKSTILGQVLLNCINQGFPVCAYSGELSKERFTNWIMQQAAGPEYTFSRQNPYSKKWYSIVHEDVRWKISAWLKGKFFLTDRITSRADSIENILELFNYAVRRFDCCMFIADNLMTMNTDVKTPSELKEQTIIIKSLKEFAVATRTTVHLVAHTRKLTGGQNKASETTDSIKGTGVIKDAADMIYRIWRVSDEEKESLGYDTSIQVWKNRVDGMLGTVKLKFDSRSRRLYPADGSPEGIRYGWEKL